MGLTEAKARETHEVLVAVVRFDSTTRTIIDGRKAGFCKLIVDYCGILKSLRQALATLAGSSGGEDDGEADPVRPEEDLLNELADAIELAKSYLTEKGGDLSAVVTSTGFDRIAAIDKAKNAINESDEVRKRFEVMVYVVRAFRTVGLAI